MAASPGRSWISRNTSLRCFFMFLLSILSPFSLRPVKSRNAFTLNGMSNVSLRMVTP